MINEILTKGELEEALKDPRRYSLNRRLGEINKERFEKSINNLVKWSFIYIIYTLFEILFSVIRLENRFNKKIKDPKKIIVFKLEHIGDVILSTPVYREIKKKYQNIKLFVVTTPNIEDTLKNNIYIDELLNINPKFTNRFWSKLNIFDKIKININNFMCILKIMFFIRPKVAISLRNDYGNIFLNYFSGASVRIGHSITPYNYLLTNKVSYNHHLHEIERNLELLREIDIHSKDFSTELFPGREEAEYTNDFLMRNNIKNDDLLIGIHVGGSGNLKWWPIERFSEIAAHLIKKYNAKIILIGKGNDEEEQANYLKDKFHEHITKSFDSSVLQKAALIKKLKLLICNDSGPMHIGAAVKTPMIAMFGPGNFRYYKPLEKIHTIFYKNISCSPCAPFVQNEKNDCPENICMKLITAKEVIKEINNKLKHASS